MSNVTRSDSDGADELVTSVRSLVANDTSAQARKMPSLDRLVLTSALRVDGDDTAADLPPEAAPAAIPATDDDIADLATLDGAPVMAEPETPAATDLETRLSQDLIAQDIGDRIDDVALRQMVLQVLREELAGDMGERITRNVRKLVRREINRVLASRDLD